MLRRRLDPERHGSAGYTSVTRLTAIVFVVGFFRWCACLGPKPGTTDGLLPGVRVAGVDLGGMPLEKARGVVRTLGDEFRVKLKVARSEVRAVCHAAGRDV